MREVDVTTKVLVRCPRENVAAYAAEPDNAPEWYVNIQSAEWKTARPLRVGSRVAFEAQFLGRRLAYTYEIAELVPGERLVMRTADGPFPMETIYEWESMSDGMTRMTLRNNGAPSGFSRVMAPFMAIAMRWANQKDLQRLRGILENKRRRETCAMTAGLDGD
jgi:uncharacterized membrane protein